MGTITWIYEYYIMNFNFTKLIKKKEWFYRFAIEKRSQIEILRKERYSVHKIASLIGVYHSTVARELNRVKDEYSTIKAQQVATSKSANKGRLINLIPQLAALIESRLQQTWSPEALMLINNWPRKCLKFKTSD